MELTEFEKKLKFLLSAFQHVDSSSDDVINGVIQDYAKDLLDLARKEILKDLPKWKKITKSEQNYLAYGYLSHDGYYLSIQELKDKLPKEE